ncbi:NUDIX hydrolase [Aestuariimicrobium soli]|uniref:NUDIX hydrolase n=1 Tax=Aestuariimicrobium soli TaxID=2035834 RepID=UPI003EBDF129
MSKKPKLQAAGACVLRAGTDGEPAVLVVHRPAYDDWSLPKGKPSPDEDLPVTAVREVLEETGCLVAIGAPLGREHYDTGKGRKRVSWWVGTLISEAPRTPDDEVDRVEWMSLKRARRKLSYPDEVAVLDRAAAMPPTAVLAIVRHGKAMDRKHWSGKDWLRPLSSRGRRQAKRLVPLLRAYGLTRAVTSTSTRCVQTLEPFAARAEIELERAAEFSEESFEDDPAPVRKTMRELLASAAQSPGRGLAVCGHRPVLPEMREAIFAPTDPMLTGEVQVLHVDADGGIIAVERHASRF